MFWSDLMAITIGQVTFRNLFSYGDYDTTIDFTKLGACAITGVVEENGVLNEKRSNGAGKSTIINSILWILFGRTMHDSNPGDEVINKLTGKNTIGKLVTANGDVITRCRNVDGNNELLTEFSDKDTTLGTSKLQQLEIYRRYDLDWNILCGSMFMSQYGKPWLGMTDAVRKKAFEKILMVDRYNYYADVAKAKVAKCQSEIALKNSTIKNLESTINTVKSELERTIAANDAYAASKQSRIDDIKADRAQLVIDRDSIIIPAMDELIKNWKLIDAVQAKISELESQSSSLRIDLSSVERAISDAEANIKKWIARDGKMCKECMQNIEHTHVEKTVDPFQASKEAAIKKRDAITAERNILVQKIDSAKNILNQRKPAITIAAAKDIINSRDRLTKEIEKLDKSIIVIESESNPHTIAIDKLRERIDTLERELATHNKAVENYSVLEAHYAYIQRSWGDRKKIKSNTVADRAKYFNDRLTYYLDRVNLNLGITIDDSLSLKYDYVKYKYFSGGEQKRADFAFMLATYDLHDYIHGQQTNILVLDDVDGWMDEEGLETLKDIVMTDLLKKVPTILVISHSKTLQGMFPHEIQVKKTSVPDKNGIMRGLSSVIEVR